MSTSSITLAAYLSDHAAFYDSEAKDGDMMMARLAETYYGRAIGVGVDVLRALSLRNPHAHDLRTRLLAFVGRRRLLLKWLKLHGFPCPASLFNNARSSLPARRRARSAAPSTAPAPPLSSIFVVSTTITTVRAAAATAATAALPVSPLDNDESFDDPPPYAVAALSVTEEDDDDLSNTTTTSSTSSFFKTPSTALETGVEVAEPAAAIAAPAAAVEVAPEVVAAGGLYSAVWSNSLGTNAKFTKTGALFDASAAAMASPVLLGRADSIVAEGRSTHCKDDVDHEAGDMRTSWRTLSSWREPRQRSRQAKMGVPSAVFETHSQTADGEGGMQVTSLKPGQISPIHSTGSAGHVGSNDVLAAEAF